MKKVNELVDENIKLVHNAIKKYIDLDSLSTIYSYDDYFQEGCIGLFKAAQSYDESKGYAFSTYATRCIRNSLYNFSEKRKTKGKSNTTVMSLDDLYDSETPASNADIYVASCSIDYVILLKYKELIDQMKLTPEDLENNKGFKLISLYLKGYTFGEAGKLLKLTDGQCKCALAKARKIIKEKTNCKLEERML